jgi:hypothetical protein
MTAHRKMPRGPVITVSITQEILERAKRANSRQCMIYVWTPNKYMNAQGIE